MEDLRRLFSLIDEMQTQIIILAKTQEMIIKRINSDQENLEVSYDNITATFKQSGEEIDKAFTVICKRVEALEALASKQITDEMERPVGKSNKLGNA